MKLNEQWMQKTIVDRCAALLCVVALVLVCVGIYIVNYGKEKA